jgi:PAS domain S-box-containing protein
MQPPYDPNNPALLRSKIIGLGEKSIQKSYYPELQRRLAELERFRALLDQSTDCFFLIRLPARTIDDLTEYSARLLGYEREALIDQRFEVLCAHSEEVRAILDKQCGENGRCIIDTQLIGKNGEPFDMEIVFSPVALDEIQYSSAVARDNSLRKRSEEQIRLLNATLEQRVVTRTEELQQTNSELEAFTYSVSHDLRAPLRSINGFSQILIEDYSGSLDGEGQKFLLRIKNASQQMAQLIDGLLEISRAGRSGLHPVRLDLSALAQEIATEIQETQPGRPVRWEIETGLQANADAVLMRTVLTNLLQNAWKFSARTPDAMIRLGHSDGQGQVTYYVQDNGVGFEMEFANRLFHPFQRLHSGSQFEGTGVGLAIVARIIRRHGGKIWAEAAPDKGASFYFTLGNI